MMNIFKPIKGGFRIIQYHSGDANLIVGALFSVSRRPCSNPLLALEGKVEVLSKHEASLSITVTEKKLPCLTVGDWMCRLPSDLHGKLFSRM